MEILLPNGFHDFFQTFSIYFLNYFIKNPQTTNALPFLTHNISAIGGVHRVSETDRPSESKEGENNYGNKIPFQKLFSIFGGSTLYKAFASKVQTS